LLDLLHLTGSAAQHATVLKWIVIPLTIMGSMAVIFRMGPASHQRGRWVTPGSVFGTIVFLSATLLFREYVQNFAQYNRIYGSLGGVMALMFWFWISSLVLLVAAEMNKVIEYAVTRKKKAKEKAGGKGDDGQVEKTDGQATQATAVVEPKTAAVNPAQANPAELATRCQIDAPNQNGTVNTSEGAGKDGTAKPDAHDVDATSDGDASGAHPAGKDPKGDTDPKV